MIAELSSVISIVVGSLIAIAELRNYYRCWVLDCHTLSSIITIGVESLIAKLRSVAIIGVGSLIDELSSVNTMVLGFDCLDSESSIALPSARLP